ncbi:hypothetical protein GF373_14790 [bacterium]|nr:hypothetical protein [bacterium]
MDWILYCASNGLDVERGVTPNQNYSILIYVAIGIFVVIFVFFVAQFFFLAYSQIKRRSEDWVEFENLIKKNELTQEEAAFLRTKLRKFGYSKPTGVLKKQAEFDRFFKKVLRRKNHHAEFLLQMIRKKVFDRKAKRIAQETSKKTASSKASETDASSTQ